MNTGADEITRLRHELDLARYILNESTGILRSYGQFGTERKVVWKVIADGRQVGLWTKRRWAKRDLRRILLERP